MIKIIIGKSSRVYEDYTHDWIYQQISNRRNDNLSVCVQITIKHNDIDIILSTGECPSGKPANRKSRPREDELFDLWNKYGLKEKDFNPKQLVKFLDKIAYIN